MLSHFHLYGELRFPGVMGRRNGLLGLREDDDDDDLVGTADRDNGSDCAVKPSCISSSDAVLERGVRGGRVEHQTGRHITGHFINDERSLIGYGRRHHPIADETERTGVLVGSLGREDEGADRLVLRDGLAEEEPRRERRRELVDVED